MKTVLFIGDTLSKDLFPMRGIPQTLFRSCTHSKSVEFVYLPDDKVSLENIKNFNPEIIVLMISDGWNKKLYEIINNSYFNKVKLIGYSTELFDVWNRKSTYEYFNFYHQYAYRKGCEYNVFSKLRAVIAPSICSIPEYPWIPVIYYPFLYAPSVHEDKISYMRKLISSNPILTGTKKINKASMVYKLGSPYRDQYSSVLEKFIPIAYGGKYKHNDDGVKGGYEFDIIKEYYSKFNYNLAIENEFVDTYWTEKVINPLLADSVPIYYDPFDLFPTRIINEDAIIRFNDRNFEEKFTELSNSDYTERFKGVPIFTSDALDIFNGDVQSAITTLDKILYE